MLGGRRGLDQSENQPLNSGNRVETSMLNTTNNATMNQSRFNQNSQLKNM